METHRGVTDTPDCLSAKYKDSFAYITIKDRLPVILTKIADTVYRLKNKIREEDGEEASDELKVVVGGISRLRHQVQTDKPVEPVQDSRTDKVTWNQCLQQLLGENDGKPITWFSASWLFLECYMYRRIQEVLELTNKLKTLDVFEEQKQNAYLSSDGPVTTLLTYLLEVTENIKAWSSEKRTDTLKQFMEQELPALSRHLEEGSSTVFDFITCLYDLLQVALWGNKCDLSISAGFENAQQECILDQLKHREPNILIDDSSDVIQYLEEMCKSGSQSRIDIILDNAGFELITDLCLAEFLISAGFASTVHLHGKAMPWFVSDVVKRDMDWTLQTLCATNNLAVSSFGSRWQERLKSGGWVLHFDDFWTTPYDFSQMKKYAPDLYSDLSKADLLFFKGDLNYRKLVGDRRWDYTTDFSTSLCGFQPAPLCSLRALKADVVTGLKSGQAENVKQQDKNWMINGNWAVISFHSARD